MPLNWNSARALPQANQELWETLHRHSPCAHAHQTLWFAALKRRACGVRQIFFEAGLDGNAALQWAGVLEVFSHPWLGFRQGVISRGPTLADLSLLPQALPHLLESAREHQLSTLRISPYVRADQLPFVHDSLQRFGFEQASDCSGFVTTQIVDLERSESNLFKGFHPKLRQDIRRSEQRRHQIRPLEIKEATAAARLADQLARLKNVPAIAPGLLQGFIEEFAQHPERGAVLGSFHESSLLSFAVFLAAGSEEMIYEYGASDHDVTRAGRTHALLWQAMQRFKAQGIRRFNLGGVGSEPDGVSNFKRRFGGDPQTTCPDYIAVIDRGAQKRYHFAKDLQRVIRRDRSAQIQRRDAQAKVYNDWYEQQRGKAFVDVEQRSVLEALGLRGKEKILELGCGTGRLTRTLAPLVASIDAMDFSKESLKVLQEDCRAFGAKICTHAADISESLPFAQANFDRVVSVQVIQHLHVSLHEKLFSEIRRVLKPGGIFVFTGYRLGRWIQGEAQRYSGDLYEYGFTAEEIRQKLAAAGFARIQVQGLLTLPARAYGLSKRLPFFSPLISAVDRGIAKTPLGLRTGIFLLARASPF